MTPEELAAIEARCRAATAGPWEAENEVDDAGFEQHELWIIMRGQPCAYRFDRAEDAQFAAAARTDVPALVAEVRRMREENARLSSALDAAARVVARKAARERGESEKDPTISDGGGA